jgi:hypothetical protein
MEAMTIERFKDMRQHVSESYNVYQATVAIFAVFDGFIFSALINILLSDRPITLGIKTTLYALLAALIGFMLAVLCFHATAHAVVRYWRFFFPGGTLIKWGVRIANAAIILMFGALGALFIARELPIHGIIAIAGGVGLFLFGVVFKHIHYQHPTIVNIDGEPPFAIDSDGRMVPADGNKKSPD